MKFKAVFFDLDGTLIDSLADLANSVNYLLAKNNFPVHKTEEYKYFAGDGIVKMLERTLPAEYCTEPFVMKLKEAFLEYYGEHYADNTVAFDGLNELLSTLKSSGVKLAVVTNKAQEMAEKVVSAIFGDVFDFVLGIKEGILPKPDPTGVFIAMRELNIDPSECAFVGDTAMDIYAGINAGAFPIGVLWGFRKKEELVESGAKAIVSNSDELFSVLIGEYQ